MTSAQPDPLAPTHPALLPRGVRVRHVANWLNLSTALGLGLARVGGARIRRGPRQLYLADHYRWRFPTGSAFTVGDVVISRHDLPTLVAHRPQLLGHEEAHSRQWMACLGLPFLPLYVASMGWSWLRTGDRAARCYFERAAGLTEGGYRDVPPRPLAPAIARGVLGTLSASRTPRSRPRPAGRAGPRSR